MEYKVVKLGPKQVMGIELRTTNEKAQAVHDIPKFWARFYAEKIWEKVPYQKTDDFFGLYTDYEQEHYKEYSLTAGCEVTHVYDIPEGFVIKKIPASKYAVFEIKGDFPDTLLKIWSWIWQGGLDRRYTGDFELYPRDFHPGKNPDLKLYISIK